MALKEKLTEQEPQQEQGLLDEAEEQDLSIMVNLAKNLIDDGGIDVIQKSEASKDQGQVIGQFLVQLGSQLGEKLSGLVDISPRIMLAEGGWVEQVSDYLQEEYGVPKDVMDRAEIYVAGMAQDMALTAQQGGTPQDAPVDPMMQQPQPPVMPQQEMM